MSESDDEAIVEQILTEPRAVENNGWLDEREVRLMLLKAVRRTREEDAETIDGLTEALAEVRDVNGSCRGVVVSVD